MYTYIFMDNMYTYILSAVDMYTYYTYIFVYIRM